MAEQLTEEEQVEALKKWWKENAMAIVIGIVIGLSVVVGVRYWFTYQEQRAVDASLIYSRFGEAFTANDDAQAGAALQQLQDEFKGTSYATLAAMQMARLHVEQNKPAEAEQLLRWAQSNAGHESLELLARTHLARLLIADGKTDEALQLVAQESGTVFDARFAEIRGDIYRQQGKAAQARDAYQLALADSSLSGKAREYIEMKMQDLPGAAAVENQN